MSLRGHLENMFTDGITVTSYCIIKWYSKEKKLEAFVEQRCKMTPEANGGRRQEIMTDCGGNVSPFVTVVQ